MILVGSYGGLRLGEQAALRTHHILALSSQIDVQEGLFEPLSGEVIIGRLKTRYSRGKVDIPRFLVEELARHIQKYPGKDGLIFTSPDGELLRPRNWRRRYWWPAVEAAGLDPSCKPHAMRHTFVSMLIAEGLSAEKVCELARHRDPGFTWRVYRHQFERAAGMVSGASEALERVRQSVRS
jgi:integrase